MFLYEDRDLLGKKCFVYSPTDEELEIMGKISKYSEENPAEFVAEVYALLLLGEKAKITNEILLLFYQFGGKLLWYILWLGWTDVKLVNII